MPKVISPSYKLLYILEKSKYFPSFHEKINKSSRLNYITLIKTNRTISLILKNDLKGEIESRVWQYGEDVFDTGRKRIVKVDHGHKPNYDWDCFRSERWEINKKANEKKHWTKSIIESDVLFRNIWPTKRLKHEIWIE